MHLQQTVGTAWACIRSRRCYYSHASRVYDIDFIVFTWYDPNWDDADRLRSATTVYGPFVP